MTWLLCQLLLTQKGGYVVDVEEIPGVGVLGHLERSKKTKVNLC